MSKYKAYFIDLDGTIYQGSKKFASGKRFIDRLKAANIPYLFVTNNSTKSPADVAANLTINHQIDTTTDQIYTSAMATADYLKALATPQQTRVLVVGEIGLEEALLDAGFSLVQDDNADFVVAALDRTFTYDKLMYATLAIQHGAKFIATNRDTNLPNERGMLPGAGAIVAAIETATQVMPTVIAKPETPIMTGSLQKLRVAKEDVVMVGDNYNTDILAGINTGIDTLLVYSGLSTHEQINQVAIKPTHEIENLDDWLV